jgi:hypothetical protein
MSYSAGLLKVTNLTASGALEATDVTVTTLNATNVSSTNIGLTNNLDLSGNLNVKGKFTINSNITVDLSGNMTVPGTFTNPAFVAANQIQDNTVISAESIYTVPGSINSEKYQYPIFDLQADVPIGIFTDATNTVVSNEFLTKNSDTDCPSGKIYYYDGVGTASAPIDGTAGTPHFPGVYGNIGTPIFVDVSDTSAYKTAIQKIYQNAPAITDSSTNIVGGSLVNMEYSSYAQLAEFSFDDMQTLCDKTYRFYTKRGWSINPPGYTPYDYSGNPSNINYFTQNASPFGTAMGIEFMYDPEISESVPSSINLSFASMYYDTYFRGGFYLGPKSLSDNVANIRPPVNIPVTSDKSVYGKAVIDGTDSVYYDINKRVLNINYASGNTWNYIVDASNFGIELTIEHTMVSFKGAYAVMKPALSTFESNGYTVNDLVSCAPNDPAAALVQVSPDTTTVDQTIYNGSDEGVQTYTYPLIDPTTEEYAGVSLIKFGYGSTGATFNVIKSSSLNAYTAWDTQSVVPRLLDTERTGQNPYNTFYQSTCTASNIVEFANVLYEQYIPKFNFDLYSTTPESMTLLDASYCVLTDPVTANLTIAIHEGLHTFELGMGTQWYSGNTEGHGVCYEMDSPYVGSGVQVPARMFRTGLIYLLSQFNGWYPFSAFNNGYENNLYSASNLGISNQTDSSVVPQIANSQYGEFYPYRYFADHYDINQQIIRRTNEIAINNMKLLTSNGFASFGDCPPSGITAGQFAYAQALWEVSSANGTPKELPTGYSEYVMSSAFLRNNASIPQQYQFLFPMWLANKNNQFSSFIGECTTAANGVFPQILGTILWSDLDESSPVLLENYGRAATNTSSLKYLDARCIVPFWPRNVAGEDRFKMGSWRRNGTGRLIDSSNVLIYNTSTGVKNLSAGPPVWTPSAVAYKSSEIVYLENLASISYVLPVAGNSGLGVTATMTDITVSVDRGNWNFAVAQFVPDGSGGSWTQLPSSGTFHNIDNPGTWNDASGEVYNGVQTSYLDAASPVSYTFNLSGLSVQTYNGVKYYPKLVCINATLDTYGQYLNIAPARCRYSGKVTITPTFA